MAHSVRRRHEKRSATLKRKRARRQNAEGDPTKSWVEAIEERSAAAGAGGTSKALVEGLTHEEYFRQLEALNLEEQARVREAIVEHARELFAQLEECGGNPTDDEAIVRCIVEFDPLVNKSWGGELLTSIGVLHKMMFFLSRPDLYSLNVRNNALVLICNILAEKRPESRDVVIDLGLIEALATVDASDEGGYDAEFRSNMAWAVLCLSEKEPSRLPLQVLEPLVPKLLWLISLREDVDAAIDALTALRLISSSEENDLERLSCVIKHEGALETLLTMMGLTRMEDGGVAIGNQAMLCLASYASIDDWERAGLEVPPGVTLVRSGIMPLLNDYLSFHQVLPKSRDYVAKACWFLSNLFEAEISADAFMAVDGLYQRMVDFVREGSARVRTEALWVLTNLTMTASVPLTQELVRTGLSHWLSASFSIPENNLCTNTLLALGKLFDEGAVMAKERDLIENPAIRAFEEADGIKALEEADEWIHNDKLRTGKMNFTHEYFGGADGDGELHLGEDDDAMAAGGDHDLASAWGMTGNVNFNFGGIGDGSGLVAATGGGHLHANAGAGAGPWDDAM